jgi:hypothetical protein
LGGFLRAAAGGSGFFIIFQEKEWLKSTKTMDVFLCFRRKGCVGRAF